MQRMPRNWNSTLTTLLVVLVALLVILASLVILGIVFGILGRFQQVILLFILGAVLAYILAPLVNGVQVVLRRRWLAILAVYLCVAAVVALVGVLLFTPFVQQSQSLVDNLRKPSQGSLQTIVKVQRDAASLHSDLVSQQQSVAGGASIPQTTVQQTRTAITTLQQDVTKLRNTSETSPPGAQPRGAILPKQATQTRIPASYIDPISAPVNKLSADYVRATPSAGAVNPSLLSRSIADAKQASAAASSTKQVVSTTPVLVLRLQDWLDSHGMRVDLRQNFGKAIQQVNNQAASMLNSAVGILLSVGNLLVNIILALIISIYFLSDGARLVRKAVELAPKGRRDEAWFFVRSLDRVLSGYLRGQLVLAAVAGLLAGLGAWVLGVPYAVLLGISTFVLQLVPVIGPLILVVPPVLVGFIFTPLPTPIFMLVYILVLEQLITNVIGPRVMGTAVGIHPLEAMAAALIGFPIAGFLGSFFAVPVVGFLHIAIREARRQLRESRAAEAAHPSESDDKEPIPATTPGR